MTVVEIQRGDLTFEGSDLNLIFLVKKKKKKKRKKKKQFLRMLPQLRTKPDEKKS